MQHLIFFIIICLAPLGAALALKHTALRLGRNPRLITLAERILCLCLPCASFWLALALALAILPLPYLPAAFITYLFATRLDD